MKILLYQQDLSIIGQITKSRAGLLDSGVERNSGVELALQEIGCVKASIIRSIEATYLYAVSLFGAHCFFD